MLSRAQSRTSTGQTPSAGRESMLLFLSSTTPRWLVPVALRTHGVCDALLSSPCLLCPLLFLHAVPSPWQSAPRRSSRDNGTSTTRSGRWPALVESRLADRRAILTVRVDKGVGIRNVAPRPLAPRSPFRKIFVLSPTLSPCLLLVESSYLYCSPFLRKNTKFASENKREWPVDSVSWATPVVPLPSCAPTCALDSV